MTLNILIKNIDILTCDDEVGDIKNGFVGIKDGYINFVDRDNAREFEANKIIDGKDKILMPGLINTHGHSAMTIFRNYAGDLPLEEWLFKYIIPKESALEEEDIYYGTMLGIAEMIKSGTTTFTDMYYHMEQVANAVSESGIRSNITKSAVILSSQKEDLKGASDYYKKWNKALNDRIRVSLEIHSTYLFTEELLRATANLARELGAGIHIHLLETLWERDEMYRRFGMDSVELCEKCGIFEVPVTAAHCVHLTDDNIDVLAKKGVNVAHNPTSNLKLGSGIARIPDMIKKGINVTLGTDGVASNNNLNMFEEINLAALIHKGINKDPTVIGAKQAIYMGTVNGAKAVGFGNQIGKVKEGMKADLLILDTREPHLCPMNDMSAAIVYSAQASDVETVIVDGEILMENRCLKTIDIEKVKYKVRECAKRIL